MEKIQQKEEMLYKDVRGSITQGTKVVNAAIVQQW